jgi:hypothetical protein
MSTRIFIAVPFILAKMETTQSVNNKMDKEIGVYSCNGYSTIG